MTRTMTVEVNEDVYELLTEAATEHGQRVEQFAARALAYGVNNRYLCSPEAQMAVIARLADSGLMDTVIGERIGMDRNRVGIIRRMANRERVKVELIPRAAVISLWQEGHTDQQIADKLGFSKAGIRRVRDELELRVVHRFTNAKPKTENG